MVSPPKNDEASDSLDLTFEIAESSDHALLRECEIISQQVSQLLLESKQKMIERAHSFKELSYISKAAKSLRSKVEILREDSRSLRLQASNLTQDYQRLEEQISEGEHDLSEATLELEAARIDILENSQKVADLKEAFESRKGAFEAIISRIQAENDGLRDSLAQIDELQERIIREREALQSRENQLGESNTVDFLTDKFFEATSVVSGTMQGVVQGTITTFQDAVDIVPSFNEVRGTISTLQEQIKEIPSLVKNIMKESMREAAVFLWDSFTNIAWSTIEAISNIGKNILRAPEIVYSYVTRQFSVIFDRTNLPLTVLGALSGCAFVMTGTPFAFVATTVVGYLLIRGV